jgi:hypothetical protein
LQIKKNSFIFEPGLTLKTIIMSNKELKKTYAVWVKGVCVCENQSEIDALSIVKEYMHIGYNDFQIKLL